MNPKTTTVEQLLEHCLQMMADSNSDTLELDLYKGKDKATFELRLVAINDRPIAEYEE